MKFEYNRETDEPRKPVAWLYRMQGPFSEDDDLALCITTDNPDRFIWAYSGGDITVQWTRPSGEALKTFYEGDSITITF